MTHSVPAENPLKQGKDSRKIPSFPREKARICLVTDLQLEEEIEVLRGTQPLGPEPQNLVKTGLIRTEENTHHPGLPPNRLTSFK